MRHARRDLVAKEIERLREEGAKLASEWRRLPYLGGTLVFVPPVYLIWGPTAGFYTFLFVPSLFLTAAYLVGVRRRENDESIAELEKQLAGWDAASAEDESEGLA